MEALVPWLAVPAAVLLVGALAAVRVIDEHHRAVVTRLGVTHRVVGPGVVLHIPVVERITSVSLRPNHLMLAVPALTRDGVAVHVTGTANWAILEPALATDAEPDAASVVGCELEDALTRAISRLHVADVLPAREGLESAVPEEVNETTAAWGIRVVTLELSDFETRLTPALLDSVRPGHRETDAGATHERR
ncbi:hypothetical protein N802_16220 [Knoellia sinensis KCTC 19936]|uniref:Band 7 domain-containing protein n=1 Tax=Knoellia sinensis KCTC 19936 TaxID=1385520 RepID=A0A0A0J7A5_9MICO|nr:SPFH domain-containing protein [Knoellia sinensis]KGN33023.1 hypothetical protein N802_16220 [Knoellia sinensis KCTC 19936]